MKSESKSSSINRRAFLKGAIFTLASCSSIALADPASILIRAAENFSDIERKEEPIFTFVQINDTHVHIPNIKPEPYENDNGKLIQLIKSINEEQIFKLPDFVILVGDIVHGHPDDIIALKRLLIECKIAKDMLSELRCPYYTVIGNHDILTKEAYPEIQGTELQAAYAEVFGSNRLNYHFFYKGILFICINNAWANAIGDKVADERNMWLENVLHTHPNVPKIIACHIPMVNMREENVLSKSFGFTSYKMIGNETWDIVRKAKDTVIAVLNGHLHLTAVVRVDDIVNISSSGTASYPCDYAHYAVYRDHIDVEMHQISKNLITPKTNIHGMVRHKRTFTDNLHKTPEEYVSGTKNERRLTIQLANRKMLR